MYKCMTVPRMADAIEPADSNFSKKSLDSFPCGDTCSVTDDTIIQEYEDEAPAASKVYLS